MLHITQHGSKYPSSAQVLPGMGAMGGGQIFLGGRNHLEPVVPTFLELIVQMTFPILELWELLKYSAREVKEAFGELSDALPRFWADARIHGGCTLQDL